QDLPGHKWRRGKKVYSPGDVLGRTEARERRAGDDARALGRLERAVLGPGDGARRHGVDADLRRKLERKRTRKRDQARLREAVEEIALRRRVGVDVGG